MRPRTLILILVSILGLLLAMGLQGCLFGGGDEGGEAADTGEGGEGAEMGPPEDMGPPGEMGAPEEMGPPGEMGEPGAMEGPPGEGAGAPMPPAEAGAPEAAAPAGADVSALVEEGMAAKHTGNYTLAQQKFEQAVAANPNSLDAHWGLAWIYAEKEMTEQAKMEFQKVIDLGATGEKLSGAQDALQRLGGE